MLWELIFLALEPWAGGPGLFPRCPFRIFMHHMWVWDQPIQCLCISATPVCLVECGFLNSIVVGLPSTWFLMVLSDVVVWGGELCLRMPPSWPEVLLPFLMWLLDVLSYENSVQLIFSSFSRVVVLPFNYHFDVVMGGSSTAFTYSWPSWLKPRKKFLYCILKKHVPSVMYHLLNVQISDVLIL